MRYVKSNMTLSEKAALEAAKIGLAEQEKIAAQMEYIAMMADVDLSDILPDEAEALNDEQEI